MPTEAQFAANRLNAQSSTGPKSDEGKRAVSLNAVRTGLTGRTVLLPFDDAEAYQALLTDYQKTFQPVGPIEKGLVQSLVDICWRLERIPGLEYALLENGHHHIKHLNPAAAATGPLPQLELAIRKMNEKDFHNLQLQENRLVRRRDREMKELRALQADRKAKEEAELKIAAQASLVAQHLKQPFELAELGFEISTQRLHQYLTRLTPAAKQTILKEALTGDAKSTEAAA